MKELSKRVSGQAFEVILSPSTTDPKNELLLSPLKKKETSLDEINKKLEAAEERRKVFLDTIQLWTDVFLDIISVSGISVFLLTVKGLFLKIL